MNRQILFKAKSTGDLAPWIEGYYHFDKSENKHYICDSESLFRYEVDPSTVCQYTGIHDVEEIKLFEGDTVKTGSEDLEYAAIEWDESKAAFQVNEYGPTMYLNEGSGEEYTNESHLQESYDIDEFGDIEITGNIHDKH